MRLAGKVALITGAARRGGIGRGIALALAAEGADIAINDVAAENEAVELVAQLEALGRRAAFLRADVSQSRQAENLVRETATRLGHLDIFVNNAGVCVWEDFLDVQSASWQRVIGVNLKGALYTTRAAAQQMVQQGSGGRIIIVSSVHAQMPFASMSVYGASKAGLRSLSDHLALELAPHGINVNHIGPGWVDSYINASSPSLQTDEDRQQTISSIPLHRPADPHDLGRAVVYLASSDGDYVTGGFLRIDGGFIAGKW